MCTSDDDKHEVHDQEAWMKAHIVSRLPLPPVTWLGDHLLSISRHPLAVGAAGRVEGGERVLRLVKVYLPFFRVWLRRRDNRQPGLPVAEAVKFKIKLALVRAFVPERFPRRRHSSAHVASAFRHSHSQRNSLPGAAPGLVRCRPAVSPEKSHH
jgi:hypothetical protein